MVQPVLPHPVCVVMGPSLPPAHRWGLWEGPVAEACVECGESRSADGVPAEDVLTCSRVTLDCGY